MNGDGMVRRARIIPLGIQRDTAGDGHAETVRRGAGRIRGPADERVSVTGRCGRLRRVTTVRNLLRIDRAAALRVEGHGVHVRRPPRIQGHIIVHRSREIVFATRSVGASIPSRERVSHALRIFRSYGRFPCLHLLCGDLAAALDVEGHGFRFRPLRIQRYRRAHRGGEIILMFTGHVRGPLREHVAVASRRFGNARSASDGDRLCGNAAAALGVEGYSGHVHRMRVHGRIPADDPEFRDAVFHVSRGHADHGFRNLAIVVVAVLAGP